MAGEEKTQKDKKRMLKEAEAASTLKPSWFAVATDKGKNLNLGEAK